MWQVIGQQRVVSLLKKGIEKGSPANAYLFIGPPHVGKMKLAINTAQAMNCQGNEPPCLECDSCQKIAQGKHVDVHIISMDSNFKDDETKHRAEISIEQIRRIQHAASLPPFEGKYKLFIINGADFLSLEAANCLLKTLEEPCRQVCFILLAKNIKTIPATVISRCQKLELTPVSVVEVERELVDNYAVETQRARVLSALSKGSIGWAISACRNEELLEHYRENRSVILDIINEDFEERFSYAARLAGQFNKNRYIVLELLNIWVDIWRDLLLVKTGLTKAITNIDIKKRLEQLGRDLDLYDIRRFILEIQETINNLRRNTNARLALEVMMMNIPKRKKEKRGS
ncbi:MAG: DNA polymerase III subunit [Dehalococcoidia bacterium]|nr:MAG: DNA polymerase III subunit [Dehalococcoidia bacterium]